MIVLYLTESQDTNFSFFFFFDIFGEVPARLHGLRILLEASLIS